MKLWHLLLAVALVGLPIALVRDAAGRGLLVALVMIAVALGVYAGLARLFGRRRVPRLVTLPALGALIPLVSVGSAWLARALVAGLARLVGAGP